jgi:hypothetical protein
MIKRTLTIAALAALTVAAPAVAQDATGTVDINGSVAERCLFTTPSATIWAGELAKGGTDVNAGRLNPAVLNGQKRTLVGWCNGTASTISVEAEELLNTNFTGTAPTGFTRRIDYTATADANGASAWDSSLAAGAGDSEDVGIFTGNVDVTISAASAPGDNLLIAGDYSGQVLVTLSPNISLQPAL